VPTWFGRKVSAEYHRPAVWAGSRLPITSVGRLLRSNFQTVREGFQPGPAIPLSNQPLIVGNP
jgi:hypothetical protein